MRVVFEKAVVHEKFSLRARVLQRGARLVLKPLMAWVPLNDRTLRALRRIDRLSARGPRSRYVEPYEFELGGVRVESMTHRYGPSSDMTVLYLHGGGFLSCGIETHRRACERLALYTGGQVISVDYVQLPEGTSPTRSRTPSRRTRRCSRWSSTPTRSSSPATPPAAT